MKYALLLAGLAFSFAAEGCMPGYTTMHRGGREGYERDSLQPPPMTINDVIALAQDSVGDDVIISQMKATYSFFRLTTDDILSLRKAGVSDKVINAMIQTSENPPTRREVRYPAYYYPSWGYYWYPYYWDPWYAPMFIRLSYRSSFYNGFYGGFHSGGFRAPIGRPMRTGRR